MTLITITINNHKTFLVYYFGGECGTNFSAIAVCGHIICDGPKQIDNRTRTMYYYLFI